MATEVVGRVDWSMDRDDEGARTYRIVHLVKGDYEDGPGNALLTPGLPIPGNYWAVGNELDVWVWCRLSAKISRWSPKGGEKGRYWLVEQTFSNKTTSPGGGQNPGTKKCSEQQFDDPLLEPQKISGSFTKYVEEASRDYLGRPMVNSAFELFRGSQNEWDNGRPQIVIEQNVLNLQLALMASLIDNVNDSVMWGLPARCVKLSDASWEKKYHGLCYKYYTRRFTFDVRFDTFDRVVLDEGTKALRGKWDMRAESPTFKQYVIDPDIDYYSAFYNPVNFIKYKDPHGENAKVILNGMGRPYDPGTIVWTGLTTQTGTGTGSDTVVGQRVLRKYPQSNLFLLNVPVSLEA